MAYIALWAIRPKVLRGVSKKQEFQFALAGLSGVTAYQLLENIAIHYTNASNVSIIVSMCPMVTAAMANFAYGEKSITPRFIMGFLLAISGVAILSFSGVGEFHLNPIGDLLALGASLCWGCYSTLLTSINRSGFDFLAATRRIFFWALLFMLPLLAMGLSSDASFLDGALHVDVPRYVGSNPFSRVDWLNLAFLGLLASAACFVAWNKACSVLGTVRATVGIYMIPVVTLLFAYVFLGERLSATGTAGAMLTIGGVIISSQTKDKRKS